MLRPSAHLRKSAKANYHGGLFRLLFSGLLTAVLFGAARGQSRPTIFWMRGAVNTAVNRGLQQLIRSPDNQSLATCGGDGTAKIRRISDGMLLRTIVDTPELSDCRHRRHDRIGRLHSRWHENGHGSNLAVRLWDLGSGAQLQSLDTPNGVKVVAMSPDGTKLAFATSQNNANVILVLNVADLSVAATLTGHTKPVTSLAFSPDSLKLASGSADKRCRSGGSPRNHDPEPAQRPIRTGLRGFLAGQQHRLRGSSR